MVKPVRDENEGPYRGEERKLPVTKACPEGY